MAGPLWREDSHCCVNGGSVGADNPSSSAVTSSTKQFAECESGASAESVRVLPSVILNWPTGFNQRHVAVDTSGCNTACSDFPEERQAPFTLSLRARDEIESSFCLEHTHTRLRVNKRDENSFRAVEKQPRSYNDIIH